MKQAFKRCFTPLLAALALALVSVPAHAQWVWRDENNRLVYSDRAPPPTVKPAQIVQQPTPAARAAPRPLYEDTTPKAAAPKPAPVAQAQAQPAKNQADKDLEARKRDKEAAEAERKAQAEAEAKAVRTADCDRARSYLRSLQEGQRIARTTAQGEREILDDTQRAAEVERAQKLLSQNCN